MQLPAKIERFLDTVTQWARQRPDVDALVLVGSYARGAGTSSSDVDLILLTDQPDNYLKSTEWVRVFGHPQGQSTEDWGKVTSVRVWYQGDLEVEFGITSPDWAASPLDPGTRSVIEAGMIILYDPQARFASMAGM